MDREATRDLILKIAREIDAFKRTELGLLGWSYLNNFHFRLPGGYHREIFEREAVYLPYEHSQASRKLRGLTHSQFFARIDTLIAELELDVEKIKELQVTAELKLHAYCFPLYVRLRREGFKHYPDLTA